MKINNLNQEEEQLKKIRFRESVLKICSKNQISQKEFAEKCHFSSQHLTNVKNSKEKVVGLKTLYAIKNQFPEFDMEYVLYGKPQLLLDYQVHEPTAEYQKPNIKLNVYDLDVQAGNMILFNDVSTEPSEQICFLGSEACDFAVKVHGESMAGKINNGSTIAVKEIKDISVIPYGQIFLIITEDLRTVKYLRKSEKGDDYVLAIPHNTKEFDSFDIPVSKIKNLYLVKKILNDEA